jgi:hypothetical protein
LIWERTFKLAVDMATARQRLVTYFQKAGYKTLDQEGNNFHFSRGSTRGSWLPLNPAEIKTLAMVRILPDSKDLIRVTVEFEVAAKFKDETNFTQEFWSDEVREFGLALSEGKYFPLKSKMLTLRAGWAILRSLGTSLIFILLWGLVSLGLTFVILRLTGYFNPGSSTDPYLIVSSVMIVVAVGAWLLHRRWIRRQKDKAGRNKPDQT